MTATSAGRAPGAAAVRLPDVLALATQVRDYAWGSPTAIPQLLGDEPTGAPVAELWVGAHPGAPSRWTGHPDRVGLDALVAADPVGTLGAATAARFGNRLPFLLKLLAAERALSLQVHPDRTQAQAGFARENAAGIPVGAADRTYQDDNHKPELLCALTAFDALCGFRAVDATVDLLEVLGMPFTRALADRVRAADDLRDAMAFLLGLDASSAADAVAQVAAGARRHLDTGAGARWQAEAGCAVQLAAQSPDEIGPAVALLLNLVRLRPGEAVFLAAGQVHAYLSGLGVEILANSDNVVRCGLTSKHVDVAELMRIASFAPVPGGPRSVRLLPGGATVYPVPVADFELSRWELDAGAPEVVLADDGPQLLLATSGTPTATGVDGSAATLRPGRAAFVPAGRRVTVAGPGTMFRSVARPDL